MSDDGKHFHQCRRCGHPQDEHDPAFMKHTLDDADFSWCCWIGGYHSRDQEIGTAWVVAAEFRNEAHRLEDELGRAWQTGGDRANMLEAQLAEARAVGAERLEQIRKLQDSANLRLEEYREREAMLRNADAVIEIVSDEDDLCDHCKARVAAWREVTKHANWRDR